MTQNKNKTVLVINLGWEQEPLITEVLAQGYQVIGIHHDHNWNKDLKIKKVHICDLRNLEKLLIIARTINPIAIVSDECDHAYFATAFLCQNLYLPGPSLASAQLTTNKWLQRSHLNKTDVLQPKHHLCQNIETAKSAALDIGYPVIIKPIDNRGSFGVNLVKSTIELEQAFLDALANSFSRLVLVEAFITGTHITIDGYCFPKSGHQSLALATKDLLGGQRQVAMNIIYPGELDKTLYTKAINNNNLVVKELGLNYGMTHAEYIISANNDIYLIEIANRGGGVHTSTHIVPIVSGINIIKQLVYDSNNSKIDLYQPNQLINQKSVILSFISFKNGSVKKIYGLDECFSTEGVEVLRLQFNEGDDITDITTDGNRHGFIISSGNNKAEALKTVSFVKQKLTVKYNDQA